MGRILFCWELGAGYGHLYRLLPISEAFIRAGMQVVFASKAAERTVAIFEPVGVKTIPAPSWVAPARNFTFSLNYAQNLLRNGYWHTPSVKQRLKDWISIIEAYQPDMVLAEHAPSALLAARIAGISRGVIGTGFTIPPKLTPMPSLQPWFSLQDGYLLQIEKAFLENLNPAIRSLGGRELATVAEIFDQAEPFLCTFPDLDHYAEREPIEYLGPILYTPQHQPAVWPEADGARIFLYMHNRNRNLRPLLTLLADFPVSVLAFISDMPKDEIDEWASENLRIVSQPVNLSEVAKVCQLMISQGGTNAATYMLIHGIPLFLLPLELEQMLWAYRLAQQGLATTINFLTPQPDISTKLKHLLETKDDFYKTKEFSKRYSGYNSDLTIQSILEKSILLMNSTLRLT